jgi:hypothetical protein
MVARFSQRPDGNERPGKGLASRPAPGDSPPEAPAAGGPGTWLEFSMESRREGGFPRLGGRPSGEDCQRPSLPARQAEQLLLGRQKDGVAHVDQQGGPVRLDPVRGDVVGLDADGVEIDLHGVIPSLQWLVSDDFF